MHHVRRRSSDGTVLSGGVLKSGLVFGRMML
jgi:hypothetical protein